ncbi:MAG: hypothetical protein ACK4S2_09215 [Gemmobacter sp.]
MPAVACRIKPGDTLSGIAQGALGSHKEWPRLYAFDNMPDVLARGGARIAHPDRIRAGDTIYLPLLGPGAPPAPGAPLVALAPLLPSASVPVAMAFDIERHQLTILHPFYEARGLVSCRFALARSDKVLLTRTIDKGFERATRAETQSAFGKLVSDTTIPFDPMTLRIGVSNGATTQGTLVQVPKTAIGVECPRPRAMPVSRAEISCGKLAGQIGPHRYVATNVASVVKLEPLIPAWFLVPLAAGAGSVQFASLVGMVLLASAGMAPRAWHCCWRAGRGAPCQIA